ncbi:glycoside hydrolase family 78 protein [Salibacteraceae bacterium]|nr:glycoside hydrolase family 78 protein [Salibacteraceae bacterium]
MRFRFPVLALLIFIAVVFSRCESPVSDLHPTNLRCEYLEDPIAINEAAPRLGWELEASGRNRAQTAYQVLVASTAELLAKDLGDLWNSGKVTSDETVNLSYRGGELTSRVSCFWKVRVWDQNNVSSDWSSVAQWSMGLLDSTDWQAKWIGYDAALYDTIAFGPQPWGNGITRKTEYRPLPCPYLRKEFKLNENIESAKVYITALGIYELHINGERVGKDYFTPGWTDYNKRIYYNAYDISSLLRQGENTIAVILADGWYAGNIADRGQHYYGKHLRLKAQLEIQREGNEPIVLITDGSWKAAFGALREADMQAGETYDARLEPIGWRNIGFDDSQWSDVVESDSITAPLEAYPSKTVQKIEEIKPIAVFETRPGVYVADMGQNFAGWANISINEKRGDTITLRFAEKLEADSSLYTRNLRGARASDTYVSKGDGVEVWEPRFTYHGFQYVEISGFSRPLSEDDITGIVVHSNLERTGSFSSSSELINKIYKNIFWSQRSNYFDVPTDCPQRDERAGWMGDAQVFMRTASYNMDVASFYKKWLVDVSDAQKDDGRFTSVAPNMGVRYGTAWGDAGVICPWLFYEIYNDTIIIAKYYHGMTRWLQFLEDNSENNLSSVITFGDWQNVNSETPKEVISTAYFKRSAELMAKMATELGRDLDVKKYNTLSDKIRESFSERLVNDSGHVQGRTQTGYLMALAFDLVPDSARPILVGHLINDIAKRDTTFSTGILGTNLLLPTLAENGHVDLAYKLLLKTDFPSWGNHVENGATTIWERWDGYSNEKGFHEDETNSLNHYAYGAVGEWMYSTIAGIQSDGPGYKQIFINPMPGGGLTQAEATYKSIRGSITSSWKLNEGVFSLDVSIPPNTVAKIYIPTNNVSSINESGQPAFSSDEFQISSHDLHTTEIKVGSGSYSFTSDFSKR